MKRNARWGLLLSLCVYWTPAHAYEGKLFSLALGGKLFTTLERRGATLYEGFQVSPVIYVAMFDDRLQFFGNSLEATDFIWERQVRLRLRLSSFSDRPLLKVGGPLTARNSRESTWEATALLECFIPDRSEYTAQVDLRYVRDLKAYSGNYFEMAGRLTLAKFMMEKDQPRIQPQLFAALGWGDAAHNGYLYGAGATEPGFTHVAYGIMVVAPARIDPHFPVVELYRYDLLGQANRSGALVDTTHGYQLRFTFAFGLI